MFEHDLDYMVKMIMQQCSDWDTALFKKALSICRVKAEALRHTDKAEAIDDLAEFHRNKAAEACAKSSKMIADHKRKNVIRNSKIRHNHDLNFDHIKNPQAFMPESDGQCRCDHCRKCGVK